MEDRDDSTAGAADRTHRRRRRPRRPAMVDNSVPSPCQSVCRFDGNPFCVGCYRSADEIREWMIMTREQKLSVLEALAARQRQSR